MPVDVLYNKHTCVFILQSISIGNICGSIQIMLVAFVRSCLLLDCESLIHVDLTPFLVIHVWHPLFSLNGIKKYLTWLTQNLYG